MSKCRYCVHWKLSSKREQADPAKRFCANKNKWVNKEDEVCGFGIDDFQMSDFFWCESSMCYRPTLGCIKNQGKDAEDCKFCTQGEEVDLAYECWRTKLVRRRLKLIRRVKI